MWDSAAIGRLLSHVGRVHNGSFLHAFQLYPASELELYYSFEAFVDPTPAVAVRSGECRYSVTLSRYTLSRPPLLHHRTATITPALPPRVP